MPEEEVQAGMAIATLILQLYFAYMEQQGKTEAELETLYQTEKKAFYENKPENLSDPA